MSYLAIERVPDHVEQAVELPIDQYRGKPRFTGWLKSYVRQVQLVEDALYDVAIERMIDFATGPRVDIIGRIVGERRRGRTDPVYKVFIRARIRINRSLGLARDVLDVYRIISSVPAFFQELFPAAMYLELLEEPEHPASLLFEMLHETKAGGVKLNMVSPTAPPETMFLWGDVADTAQSLNGFGDSEDPQDFGLLSEAVTLT